MRCPSILHLGSLLSCQTTISLNFLSFQGGALWLCLSGCRQVTAGLRCDGKQFVSALSHCLPLSVLISSGFYQLGVQSGKFALCGSSVACTGAWLVCDV